MKQKLKVTLPLLWSILAFLWTPFSLSAPISFTPEEQFFIQQHPVITLGTDQSWEPYVIPSPTGKILGYDAEILAKLSEITGITFQLELGAWGDMQEQAKQRKIDGLSTGAAIPDRLSYLNFSDPYLTLRKSVFVALSNPSNVTNSRSLSGKTVVIQKGNLADIELAKQFKGIKILFVDTVQELLSAVVSGQADATFGNGATLYLANKLGMPYLQTAFHLDQKLELVLGVRNDWPEAISIINKALASIPLHEKISIQTHWFSLSTPVGRTASEKEQVVLTPDQQKHLKTLTELTFCAEEDWAPFIQFSSGNNHFGIISDVLKLIEERLGVAIELTNSGNWHSTLSAFKEGQCDSILPISQTLEREAFMDFSNSIFSSPIVLVTRQDQLFVPDITDLKDKPIAVIRSSAVEDLLNQNYQGMNIQLTDSFTDALREVSEEKIFGYIGSYEAIANHINSGKYINLKVSSTLPMNYELSFGFHKDMSTYRQIMNKAIHTISDQELSEITNRWVGVRYETPVNYWPIFWALFGVALFVGLLIYRNRVISSYNNQLQTLNQKLAEQATTDQLTGLSNRYLLDQAVQKALATADRYKEPVSMILFDLDLFKQINDRFGHQVGDIVLQEVSQLMKQQCRQADTLGRWGGEEFLLLCPKTDLDGATALANKFREVIKSAEYSVDFPISVSAGATCYHRGEDYSELLKRVDDALYQAKDSGRDQIVTLECC